MLFDKTLSSRPLSSPRHSDEAAPPPSENDSDAPPARPRAVSDDEKKPTEAAARPETPPQEKRRRRRQCRPPPLRIASAAANGRASTRVTTTKTMTTTEPLPEITLSTHHFSINALMARQGSRRCQVIAAAAATDALSTCIGSNSLCCGSTMSRHLGDTCGEGSFNPHPQSPLILGQSVHFLGGFLPLLNE